MVLESVVADLLNRFLGDYVENLNKSQLKLGIWGGKEPLPSAAPCPPEPAGTGSGSRWMRLFPMRGSRAIVPLTPRRGGRWVRSPREQVASSGPSVPDGRCVRTRPRSLGGPAVPGGRGLLTPPLSRRSVGGAWVHSAGLSAPREETPTSIKPCVCFCSLSGVLEEARWCCWICGRAHGAVPRVPVCLVGCLGSCVCQLPL